MAEKNIEDDEDDIRISTDDSSGEETPATTLSNTNANTSHNSTTPAETDLEKAETKPDLEKTVSQPIAPTKTQDGNILVDWYTTDDPENPQNWSNWRRAIVVSVI